jgi:hypothetical protein
MRVGLAVAVCCLLGLAGCSGGSFNNLDQTQAAPSSAGTRLVGTVHGGRQPIAGAHVYLFAANTTGYGQASVSLLSGTGNTDSVGTYVTTGADGSFSISGDYTCTAGQQVYLYALGGDPGAGANPAAGLMAALGNCPVAGTFSSSLFIAVNEVSTVVAAYAFAGFATDATHVSSSGTALAQTGIANAFANTANLETISTGAALATTPAGNGTVPQAEINTLGNILAACVNSNGTGSSGCSTLFANALSGGTTGNKATDTATAAINIAHNPGVNVGSLYGLAGGTPPFAPGLSAAPADWTLAIVFTGGGLEASTYGVAIDGSGNAWFVNTFHKSIIEVSSTGVLLSPGSGYTSTSMVSPRFVAIDPTGNAWITNSSELSEVSSAGNFLSGPNGFPGDYSQYQNTFGSPTGIAIDGQGNVWVPTTGGVVGVTEFTNAGSPSFLLGPPFSLAIPNGVAIDSSGAARVIFSPSDGIWIYPSPISPYTETLIQPGGGLNNQVAIAIDGIGNTWVVNGSVLVKVSPSGTAVSGSGGYSGISAGYPTSIAIDGAGTVWVAGELGWGLVQFSGSGSMLSGPVGYRSGDQGTFWTLAIDGSGDVWVPNLSAHGAEEIIGAATPVVTPLSVGAKNNTLGTRP